MSSLDDQAPAPAPAPVSRKAGAGEQQLSRPSLLCQHLTWPRHLLVQAPTEATAELSGVQRPGSGATAVGSGTLLAAAAACLALALAL